MDTLGLGQYLRDNREAQERTLDDAVAALRIRRSILEGFEQGNFNELVDNPIQLQGFLRNYARYLGLDENLIIQYYTTAMEEAERKSRRRRGSKRNKRDTQTNPVAPRKVTDTPPALPAVSLSDTRTRPRRGRSVLMTLLILVTSLAAVGAIIYITVELIRTPADGVSLVEGGRAGLLGIPPTATVTITPTPTPVLASPTPPDGGGVFDGEGVLVNIEVTQRTWLTVFVDGEQRFSSVVSPGAIIEYSAFNNVQLAASNALALDVTYNGVQQRPFGGRGQRVDVTFRREEVIVETSANFEPTPEETFTPLPSATSISATLLAELTPSATDGPSPTPSDTPTITLTPSITPTPSNTPLPSNTPTITLTPTITFTPSNTPPPTNTPTITPTPTETQTPSPTAVLPPRVTQEGLPPTKSGG